MKSNETEPARSLGLTGKQGAVLALLVGGQSIEGAAKAQGVRPATVHDWLKKPEFRGAYQDALSDVISHASGQLKAACSVAVATLREVAEDTAAPRVSAARAIIELTARMIEQDELTARIEALESLSL
jgi:phosphoenolpyruvate-protein kinase (PTS system EI component)